MFETIRTVPPVRQPRVLAKFVAGIDYLVPFLDIGYIFFWIPGLILFVFGYPLIVSWVSMLVIPITRGRLRAAAPVAGAARVPPLRRLSRSTTSRGFWGYLFAYQALTSSASLRGYLQYLTGAARRWR